MKHLAEHTFSCKIKATAKTFNYEVIFFTKNTNPKAIFRTVSNHGFHTKCFHAL